MLAESAPRAEQEFVDRIVPQRWRRQRVIEWLLPEIIECALRDIGVTATGSNGLGAPLSSERACPARGVRRELERKLAHGGWQVASDRFRKGRIAAFDEIVYRTIADR